MQINYTEFNQWIAALRSGEYKQTHGQLQGLYGYCCLGVGCKVLIPEEKQERDSDGRLMWAVASSQRNSPSWFKSVGADFINKTNRSLISLNDERGFTFDEIADVLELVYVHKMLD